jgi:hypothetical protein
MNLSILIALITQTSAFTPCKAAAFAPTLDHTIIVVRDLPRATQNFRGAGFMIKPGRLHANGLLNNHIKFPDGTEIELMTVQGEPRDEMARGYVNLLSAGEGGVYVALKVGSLTAPQQHAEKIGLETKRSASGGWQFLSFPHSSSAAAVFFTAGTVAVQDADSIFRHDPRATALAEVWLEGDAALETFLRRLGAAECGVVRNASGQTGKRFSLKRGNLVVVPRRDASRPRVLGAVLTSSAARPHTIRPLPNFWIEYRE